MSHSFLTALKAEITRLARKEAKKAVEPVRKPVVQTRSAIAELKRRVDALEHQVKILQGACAEAPPAAEVAPERPAEKGWITGKGVRGLRQSLGLSQAQFASLVGVSPNSVYKWESHKGMLQLRRVTKAALLQARGMSAREARDKLAAAAPVAKDKRRKA